MASLTWSVLDYRIRHCIIAGCWECAEFETCTKLDFMHPVHDDGHIKNLNIIKKQGLEAFITRKQH